MLISLGLIASYSFFFNDTATTEIYTLSLHDALPISSEKDKTTHFGFETIPEYLKESDRKSTRLNSSHDQISYAVFCLKKKNKKLRLMSFSLCSALEDAGFFT